MVHEWLARERHKIWCSWPRFCTGYDSVLSAKSVTQVTEFPRVDIDKALHDDPLHEDVSQIDQ